MRKLSLIICVVCVCGVLEASGKKQIDPQSAALWNKYIKDKPQRVLNHWNLVNGLRLCNLEKKIDNKLAAFATVAFGGTKGISVGDFVITEKKFIVYAQNLKGTSLTGNEKKEIKKLYDKVKKFYGDRSGPAQYLTFWMGKVLALGLTVQKKEWLRSLKASIGIGDPKTDEEKFWIKRWLNRIAKYHGWTAIFETGENIDFQTYQKAVDMHITPLIEKNGYYEIVFGYLRTSDVNYLIIADLSKIPYETTGMFYLQREIEAFEALPPDDPWRKMYEGDKKNLKFVRNLLVRSNMPLHPGFSIEPFEKGKYHAYFIHSWKKSVEAWEPEIRKIIGKEK